MTPQWRTSTYSGPNNECVEVASSTSEGAAIRDSKDRMVGVIRADGVSWSALIAELKRS